MPVHTIRIETTSPWCSIEIRSAGTWARAPGRRLTYEAHNVEQGHSVLEIDDRTVRIMQPSTAGGNVSVSVQLATDADRVSLQTDKDKSGSVRLVSAINTRTNDGSAERNPLLMTLYLSAASAAASGAGLSENEES